MFEPSQTSQRLRPTTVGCSTNAYFSWSQVASFGCGQTRWMTSKVPLLALLLLIAKLLLLALQLCVLQ
uniref:Uncharacterized protein n=2 Tax=Arundo donax TaxID=35708 RepID=A0A0A8ZWA3_ARUDO